MVGVLGVRITPHGFGDCGLVQMLGDASILLAIGIWDAQHAMARIRQMMSRMAAVRFDGVKYAFKVENDTQKQQAMRRRIDGDDLPTTGHAKWYCRRPIRRV